MLVDAIQRRHPVAPATTSSVYHDATHERWEWLREMALFEHANSIAPMVHSKDH